LDELHCCKPARSKTLSITIRISSNGGDEDEVFEDDEEKDVDDDNEEVDDENTIPAKYIVQ